MARPKTKKASPAVTENAFMSYVDYDAASIRTSEAFTSFYGANPIVGTASQI